MLAASSYCSPSFSSSSSSLLFHLLLCLRAWHPEQSYLPSPMLPVVCCQWYVASGMLVVVCWHQASPRISLLISCSYLPPPPFCSHLPPPRIFLLSTYGRMMGAWMLEEEGVGGEAWCKA